MDNGFSVVFLRERFCRRYINCFIHTTELIYVIYVIIILPVLPYILSYEREGAIAGSIIVGKFGFLFSRF